MKNILPLFFLLLFGWGCSVQNHYQGSDKIGPEELQNDYTVFQNILSTTHPSLYWYTTKDSLDARFARGREMLKDSMTEMKFRNILSYTVAAIHCGHTTIKPSKKAARYLEKTSYLSFPLNIKVWPDTMMVINNLNRKDTAITRGAIIEAIEGRPVKQIVDSLFTYLSADGWNTTHKYQSLSNNGGFRNLYASVYGLRPSMKVDYTDTFGIRHTAEVHPYSPVGGTRRVAPLTLTRKERKQIRQQAVHSLRIDTAHSTAFIELNSFSKNNGLRRFFRSTFKTLKKQHIQHAVIDLRSNGGGSVVLSNLLTKYIATQPFKIADSIYALNRKLSYSALHQDYFSNRLFLLFMTHKGKDGHYHFRYYENKFFHPKTKNHFDGQTYLLTGGNTFSAAALFAQSLKAEKKVSIIGEETGGGAYGNSAWLIPDITLPRTGVRFRLPLFRLVIDRNASKGRGVMPTIVSEPTLTHIRSNVDFKMERVLELIRESNQEKLSDSSTH